MVVASVNSASVRTSRGESVSLRTLMSTISPMMLARWGHRRSRPAEFLGDRREPLLHDLAVVADVRCPTESPDVDHRSAWS